MLPTQPQRLPSAPAPPAGPMTREREEYDLDKVSEENGRKKTSTFRPSGLHGNQLGADKCKEGHSDN
jgi:hypothetical protein